MAVLVGVLSHAGNPKKKKNLGKPQVSADSTGSLISGDLKFDLSAEAPRRGDKRAQSLAREGPQIEHSTVPGGLHICLALRVHHLASWHLLE